MQIDLSVITVNSKKTGKDYKALQVVIGKWKKLVLLVNLKSNTLKKY